MDDQSWKGLKETAGSSSQVRHHVGAVCFLLSFSFVSLNFELSMNFMRHQCFPSIKIAIGKCLINL